MSDLEFTKTGEWYTSDTFTPNGDTAVELTFEKKGAQILFQESLSGVEWQTCAIENHENAYYLISITNILEGLQLRVVTNQEPTTAKYNTSDD